MRSLSVRACVVVLVVSATPLLAQEPGADDALIERLEQTVVDADYRAVDFEDVIEDLRQKYDLNIHVSWKLLDGFGIRKDKRLEVRLKGVSLATLLDMLLREAYPDPDVLGYAVDGGVLLISTKRYLARSTVLRTYDVTDLIESGYAIRRFASTPVLSLEVTGREFLGGEVRRAKGGRGMGGGGSGGGGGGFVYGDPSDGPDRLSEMERALVIRDLLTGSVDPEYWAVNGGDIASIRYYNGVFFIRHTPDGHRRVEAFLDLVRSSMPRALDGQAIVVRLRADKAAQWRRDLEPRFPRLTARDIEEVTSGGEDEGVLFRASTSGFNAQRMWFSAVAQRDVVTSMKVQTAEQVNAFAPVTGFVTDGLELVVLPLLCANEDAMLLDVQMAWIPSTSVSSRDVTLAGGEAGGSIDQTKRSMRTVSTTAKVSLGEGLALSIPRRLDDAGRPAEYEDWLIIHVREPGVVRKARRPSPGSTPTPAPRAEAASSSGRSRGGG